MNSKEKPAISIWGHMTQKGGQGCDPKFGCHYFENGCRYSLGYSGAPIGNDTMVMCLMTLRDSKRSRASRDISGYIWMQISGQTLEIETELQTIINRKRHSKSNGHVIDDIRWTWKVKGVTSICLSPISLHVSRKWMEIQTLLEQWNIFQLKEYRNDSGQTLLYKHYLIRWQKLLGKLKKNIMGKNCSLASK